MKLGGFRLRPRNSHRILSIYSTTAAVHLWAEGPDAAVEQLL